MFNRILSVLFSWAKFQRQNWIASQGDVRFYMAERNSSMMDL